MTRCSPVHQNPIGIAARQLQAAGCRVLGVEPDPRMAEVARRYGVPAEVAAFENWDPAGRTFDTVVAAQAWHWIDPAAGAAQAARVLRPGGRLAVFWNVFQPPPALAEAFGEVYERILPGAPNLYGRSTPMLTGYEPMFTAAADGIRASGAFTEPQQWRDEWQHPYTRTEWLDQVPTHGGFALLPPQQREDLLTGIAAAIGDGFTMAYTTVTVTTTCGRSR
jgi:SAM-dependent methyltransferase